MSEKEAKERTLIQKLLLVSSLIAIFQVSIISTKFLLLDKF